MNFEENRLLSFKYGWSLNEMHTSDSAYKVGAYLAATGFFFTGVSNTIKCAFCSFQCIYTETFQNEHARAFPECKFLVDPHTTSNVALQKHENIFLFDHTIACYPEYSSLDNRIKTFTNWPKQIVQTPKDLAIAGFIYTNIGDHTKCFCCNINLQHWDTSDNPWIEHAKHYPSCSYLILSKGKIFIDNVQANYNTLKNKKCNKVHTTPNKEEKHFSEKMLCVICCDNIISSVFFPCNHASCCSGCSSVLRKCPLCRHVIEKISPVFFSF